MHTTSQTRIVVCWDDLEINRISVGRFAHTIGWAILASSLIVGVAATLGRAASNLKAALTDKPDIAVYLLLEDEGVTQSTLLRGRATERDYLVETAEGPKVVKLKKGDEEWYVASKDALHADYAEDSEGAEDSEDSEDSEE